MATAGLAQQPLRTISALGDRRIIELSRFFTAAASACDNIA
jgi:hypothetical protein